MTDRPSASPSSGDLDVRLLESAPAVPASFARGLATSAGRPGARGGLPTQRLMLAGVQQDVRRLADYSEITGSVLSDRLPATWLHVLTFPLQVALMAGRDFPFPMMGMVHVANTMTQHRPVTVGEELVLSSWTERLAPHRKGHTVDLVGEARVRDQVVWEGRSTYLARGKSPDRGPGVVTTDPDGTSGVVATDPDGTSGVVTPDPHGIPGTVTAEADPREHAIPGTELATWRLPANLGRRYASVAGDANPIHLSALTARALGFPRAIAHGMWTHARALAAVEPRLPAAFVVDAQFVKPILLPSTVVLRGGVRAGSGELAVTSRDATRLHLSMQVSAR